eukprot:5689006-Amphidinium_carterae.1
MSFKILGCAVWRQRDDWLVSIVSVYDVLQCTASGGQMYRRGLCGACTMLPLCSLAGAHAKENRRAELCFPMKAIIYNMGVILIHGQ